MLLSVLALPLNAFLNWLLIFGNWGFPRLELVGAAWGTLITRSLIFFILAGIIFSYKRLRRYVAVRRSQWKFKWGPMSEILRIGVPSRLKVGMEVIVFAVSAIIVGTMGAVDQAAHQMHIN